MGSLFNPDNSVMRFLVKVCDILILGLLWFLCSIPIFTIGASTTAAYYVTLKIVRNEEGYTVRSFFHAFKSNFKQATIIWLLLLLVLALTLSNMYYYLIYADSIGAVRAVVTVVGIVILAGWLAVFNYVFSLLGSFENTIKQTLRNAVLISLMNYTYTIAMIAVDLVVISVSLRIMPLLGVPFAIWINSSWLNKVFPKYMEKGVDEEKSESEDTAND